LVYCHIASVGLSILTICIIGFYSEATNSEKMANFAEKIYEKEDVCAMKPIEVYMHQLGLDIKQMENHLKYLLSAKISHFTIQSRIKDETAIKKKMRMKKTLDIFQLKDIYAFRVLVSNIEDAFIAYNILIKNFPCEISKTKNYLLVFKPVIGHEGYGHQALQATFWYNNCRFEVQITTPKLHERNESMHLEYKHNKYGGRL